MPQLVGAALLASAEGYTPRAKQTLDQAREDLGVITEIATALAESLPAPKAPARKSRRRRRKKRPAEAAPASGQDTQAPDEASGDADVAASPEEASSAEA